MIKERTLVLVACLFLIMFISVGGVLAVSGVRQNPQDKPAG